RDSGFETQRLSTRSVKAATDTCPPSDEFNVRAGVVDGKDLPVGNVKICNKAADIFGRSQLRVADGDLDLPDLMRVARLDRELAAFGLRTCSGSGRELAAETIELGKGGGDPIGVEFSSSGEGHAGELRSQI